MSIMRMFVLLMSFASLFYAIPMLEPYSMEVSNGQTVDLGEMGPGQTISISLDGRPSTGGMFGVGGAYENATVTELPQGWSFKGSDWAGIPLQVQITAYKYAAEGDYISRIEVRDEMYEGLENITFFVKIKITHDVMDASLDSSKKTAMAGQPARFYITVTNKGNAGDVFTLSSTNVPKWAFKKQVYVPPKSSKTIYYEVASDEEETYSPVINVVSEASPMIEEDLTATVNVNSWLAADYKATNNGMLFFPAMSGIIYSLAGIISNLF